MYKVKISQCKIVYRWKTEVVHSLYENKAFFEVNPRNNPLWPLISLLQTLKLCFIHFSLNWNVTLIGFTRVEWRYLQRLLLLKDAFWTLNTKIYLHIRFQGGNTYIIYNNKFISLIYSKCILNKNEYTFTDK
jgi:hypothetical protein